MPSAFQQLFRGFKLGAAGVLSTVLLASPLAHADTPRDVPRDFSASLVCRAERSFVLCLVPVSATPGWHLKFAEVNLLTEPPFLKAVARKSKFDEEKASRPDLRLGFLVKQPGSGDISVQARVLVCSETNGWCDHLAKVIKAVVTVPR
jgi:hypothetical protein